MVEVSNFSGVLLLISPIFFGFPKENIALSALVHTGALWIEGEGVRGEAIYNLVIQPQPFSRTLSLDCNLYKDFLVTPLFPSHLGETRKLEGDGYTAALPLRP